MPNACEIAGYASLFGLADLAGDVVFAGAFVEALAERGALPMLLDHDPRLLCGVWRELREDARGLFVEGTVLTDRRAGGLALRRLNGGLDGLSIGFTPLSWRSRPGGGRELLRIHLWEVSLVDAPMLPQARLVPAFAAAS
jgi:hypothetical protein